MSKPALKALRFASAVLGFGTSELGFGFATGVAGTEGGVLCTSSAVLTCDNASKNGTGGGTLGGAEVSAIAAGSPLVSESILDSVVDEKKFVAKNSHFWSLKREYLRIEYEIRVIIGPADIRFELWFDNQKLSRDEAISVEWTPAAPSPSEQFDPSTYGRVELPDTPLTSMSGGLEKGSIDSS
ncbi:hypothetical protein SLS61_004111 [Didymella pomorum]